MKNYLLHRPSKKNQYLISILTVCAVATIGLGLQGLMGYRVIAFMLLVTVSVLAMFLDIFPVLMAAFLSALLWDILFIPPRFTFIVHATEDRLLLLTYFIVASVNAVLTYKIRQMQKEIRAKEEKANAIKFYNTLFNSLSHELRTPITTIIGAADNLQTGSDRLTSEDKSELLEEISTASLRLNQQVENLLNMSRLESGYFSVKKDWCDINELVYKTLQRLEPALLKYHVAVFIPERFPLFKLDFGLMEQVLYNLISNAAIHTPEDSTITIIADCQEEKFVLTIGDNGPGFPENEIKKVFDKFYRLQGTKTGGTGLGLSIARGFIEAHNGNIRLENLPVCGAKFTIEIPTETSYITGLKNE